MGPNPWTVSNAMFARQIGWLRAHFELISLDEAQRRIRAGHNPRPCVSITFDDGYADNCQRAIPLLVERRIPCTYFVTLHNVLTGEPFPHDLATGSDAPPNTLEQLRAMAAAGIEIGAHGCRHADLGAIRDPARLCDEVVAARDELRTRWAARPLFRLSLRTVRESRATPSRWPERPATRACARPTAASTSPATTRSTCNASPSTTT